MPIFSMAVTGCMQFYDTNSNRVQPRAAVVAVATEDPVVLSGALYTEGKVTPPRVARAPSPAPVASAPPARAVASAPTPPAVAPTPTRPLIDSRIVARPAVGGPTPNAGTGPIPPSRSPIETDAPTAAAVEEKEFPNINVTPAQPGAKLLTPEERAKLITELNALAARGKSR